MSQANQSAYEALAPRDAHKLAVTALENFRVNGAFAFGSDAEMEILQSISGLCTLLGQAYTDCDEVKHKDPGAELGLEELYPVFAARSFDAIKNLTAIALFMLEGR